MMSGIARQLQLALEHSASASGVDDPARAQSTAGIAPVVGATHFVKARRIELDPICQAYADAVWALASEH